MWMENQLYTFWPLMLNVYFTTDFDKYNMFLDQYSHWSENNNQSRLIRA